MNTTTPTRQMSPTPRDRAAGAVAELVTILGVWAHPDDEAYLSAGLMRLALENGQRVVCVTATRGELGTEDPSTWPPHRLAAAREVELAASFAALAEGLDGRIEHHWMDHRDGRCAGIRSEVGAAEVPEDAVLAAIKFGYEQGVKPLLELQEELIRKVGATTKNFGEPTLPSDEVVAEVARHIEKELTEARRINGKAERSAAIDALRKKLLDENYVIPDGI